MIDMAKFLAKFSIALGCAMLSRSLQQWFFVVSVNTSAYAPRCSSLKGRSPILFSNQKPQHVNQGSILPRTAKKFVLVRCFIFENPSVGQ
jgi:hypothetical protein